MRAWYYFCRPRSLSFHNLTTTLSPPYDLGPLLGLGPKFIPTPRYSNGPWELDAFSNSKATLHRMERSLKIRCFFADQGDDSDEENLPEDLPDQYNPRMYIASNFKPPIYTYPWIVQKRFHNFRTEITKAFRRQRGRSNLLPYQRRALQWAQTQDDFVVCLSDKNLGFCIMEKTQYIRRARALLDDPVSYTRLEEEDALFMASAVEAEIKQWIEKYKRVIDRSELKFLRRHLAGVKDPFAVFYILAKIHKDPIGQRPVVSYSGSLLYGLAVWCDDKLQPLAQKQKSYIQSSLTLKEQLEALELPPNAVLYTADARAMYTNIPAEPCLQSIAEYLHENFEEIRHVSHPALLDALRIVMTNNLFKFGDTYWIQNNGAAMGAPPCPPWSGMYFAPYEDDSCDVFSEYVTFQKRYIDDVFGIWLRQPGDDAKWERFKAHMNRSNLVWDFSERARSVVFLDLTITVTPTGAIHTDLYDKPLNLHAYLPPHSAHPPGILRGLVKGMLYRFKTLCSDPVDQRCHTQNLYNHLRLRGYHPNGLRPIFAEGLSALYPDTAPLTMHPPQPAHPPDAHPLFFRIQYHPSDPPSSTLQQIWRTSLFKPPGSRPLSDLDSSHRNGKIKTNRMIVCYNRAPNLENLVSSKRNLSFKNGPTVSSFFDD